MNKESKTTEQQCNKHAVTKSREVILLTHDEAKYLNKVIRKKEEKEGFIAGYLLEILIKIENQFPDIKS